jgi:DNA invertase Pin-like site-specific DNA recombinase
MKKPSKNCAIYCRKSTEEGLDMDFNTLDAQRESCEAYITSQRAEGWKAVNDEYSDGGYSGGNLNRPGLQKLLADIKAGKVQTVVVYKIDRLTRSLMDFSKLVEVFDEHGVSFVSVTQSFNTTTSMGRLTLNVLLSFAQFEREVSAERIRDKIAASKKKGMWMGGNPPIGYEAINKKLIINQDDAKMARRIFERYLALGCVAKLKQEFDFDGITSKQRLSKRGNKMGGKLYSRGALYGILQNPIYIGKIRHKDQSYDGQHPAIIPKDLWDAVQKKMADQSAAMRGHKKASDQNLLKGLLFDCEGTAYSPDFTNKGKTRYRYYISQNLIQYRGHPKGTMARIPAHEIEAVVIDTIHKALFEILALDQVDDYATIEHITSHTSATPDLVRNCVSRVIVKQGESQLDANPEALRQLLQERLNLEIPKKFKKQTHPISITFTTRRSYKGAVIMRPENPEGHTLDLAPYQLRNLVRGIIWRDEHFSGMTLPAIAEREGFSKQHVHQMIMKSMAIA